MSLWLTDDEVTELTGKKQNPKRIEALARLTPRVVFRVRADGFPLVDRAQFQTHAKAPKSRINWEAAGV